MKLTKNLGMLLLGLWVFGHGVVALFSINNEAVIVAMRLLAIAAGIAIVLFPKATTNA